MRKSNFTEKTDDARRIEALELENAALKKRLDDLMLGGAEASQAAVTGPAEDEPGQATWMRELARLRSNEALVQVQAQRAVALLELPKLAEQMDEKSFMQRGQEIAEDLTGSEISFIHFVNNGGEDIELVTWSRRTIEHYCTAAYDSHYPLSKAGIWADSLREGRPVVFNDYASYPHKRGLPEGHSPLGRLISVPVIESGQVVMMTGVGNKKTDYTDFDIETVELISRGIWGIVQRKRAEAAVSNALARVDRLAQHVPGVLHQYHVRPDGSSHFPYVSAGVEDIYGALPEEVFEDATAVFDVIHPDDISRVVESIQASARDLSDWHQQYRVNLPDGRMIWLEGHSSPEPAPDGGMLWHGHTHDITDRKNAESQLLEQLEELRRWQRAMLDREGRILSMKEEVNELLARAGQPPRYGASSPAEGASGAGQSPAEPGRGERENGNV